MLLLLVMVWKSHGAHILAHTLAPPGWRGRTVVEGQWLLPGVVVGGGGGVRPVIHWRPLVSIVVMAGWRLLMEGRRSESRIRSRYVPELWRQGRAGLRHRANNAAVCGGILQGTVLRHRLHRQQPLLRRSCILLKHLQIRPLSFQQKHLEQDKRALVRDL